MNPETSRWLLSGAKAFLEDQKLISWNGISKENFVFLLTSIFRTSDFEEATRLLEQVVEEELIGPSIPPNIKTMVEEWEKAKGQEEEIKQRAAEKVERFLEEQKRLISAKRVWPILPLAGPTSAPRTPEKKIITDQLEKTRLEIGKKLERFNLSKPLTQQLSQELTTQVLTSLADVPWGGKKAEERQRVFSENFGTQATKKLKDQGLMLTREENERLVVEISTTTRPIVEIVSSLEPSEREIILTTIIFTKKLEESLRPKMAAFFKEPEKEFQAIQRIIGEVAQLATDSLLSQTSKETTENEYEELVNNLRPQIEERLTSAGISFEPKQISSFIKTLASTTQKEAINFAFSNPYSVPKSVLVRLLSEEGVAFIPIFTMMHPQASASFIQKVVLAVIVKPLQIADKIAGEELKGNAINEWRALLHQGLTAADIQTSIAALQKAGLLATHPTIKGLEMLTGKLKAYEQAHPIWSRILKQYHEFSKLTGRRQIFLPEHRLLLPRLFPPTLWSSRKGYAWQLRGFLNNIGVGLGTHQKVAFGVSKVVIRFTFPNTFAKIITFGKAVTYKQLSFGVYKATLGIAATAIGKTVVGQAIKKGIVWGLTRLGLTAIPTGVTQVIGVGLIAFDVLKTLFKNPALVIAAGLTLIALPFLFQLLPLLALLATIAGVIMLGIGIISAVSGAVGAVVSAVSGVAATIATTLSTALASLTASAVSATLPLIAVVGIGGIAGATMVTNLTTSAAFLKQPPPEGSPISTGSKFIELNKSASVDGLPAQSLPNEAVDDQKIIQYSISVTAKDKTLTNIKITDDTSVTSKDGGDFKVVQDESGKPIGPWDQTNEPTLAKLENGQSWTKSYQIRLSDPRFKDSVINNNLTITNAENETKTYALSLTIGSPPASSCPVKNPRISCASYPDCHGSNSYWGGEASVAGACGYPIGGYWGPNDSSSICYGTCSPSGICGPTYGFATDVANPPGEPVFLPAVYGKVINWTFANEHSSLGGAWGYGRTYLGTDGEKNYLLYLTHMNPGEGHVSNAPSGTQIGTIFNMSGSHVHVEMQINGNYVKPEFLCQ